MNLDSNITPLMTDQAVDVDVAQVLLDQILEKAPPLLEEGLFLSAISHSFSVESLKALRARDDNKDQRLVERLLQFSFIWSVGEAREGEAQRYSVQALERDILIRKFIEKDLAGFVQAHQRILQFRQSHPNPDLFVRNQSILYHLLITDPEAGIDHLMQTFRAYNAERRLAAADRLLSTVEEALPYLVLMQSSSLPHLSDTLAHLQARLKQLHGDWAGSLGALKELCTKSNLDPKLAPHVARGYGYALSRSGMYVEAIQQYRFALTEFSKRKGTDYERALTMLHIGDAYLSLAVATRGEREIVRPLKTDLKQVVSDIFSLVIWLPLIIYLSFFFGWRVWSPNFWPMLRGLDWIIARLFATSARWYHQAAPLLAKSSTDTDKLQAEAKLAYLALAMGDLTVAIPSFESLLKDDALGEYNRARIQAALGQAQLRSAQIEEANEHFRNVLPILQAYDDVETEAQVTGLLAQASLLRGKHTESIEQHSKAMMLYKKQQDIVGLTEVAERLKELEKDTSLGKEVRTLASTTSLKIVMSREYLLHFKNPLLIFFRFASLIVLSFLLIIVPLKTINLDTNTTLQASTTFHAVPVLVNLLANDPTYSPKLDQELRPSGNASFEPQVALSVGVIFLLAYLVVYTTIGLIVIAQTDLKTLQQVARSHKIRVDLESITLGEGVSAKTIKWIDVKRVIFADVTLNGQIRPDSSSTTLITQDDYIVISGNLAWYQNLRDRIKDVFATNKAVKKEDLSYQILPSKSALWYATSFIILVGFMTCSIVAPDILVITFGIPYSLSDIYPYIYIGMFLPPALWGTIQPLRVTAQTSPRSSFPLLFFGAGVLLAITYWLTPKPWLISPDYYIPLFAIVWLLSALHAIWQARDLNLGRPIYPQWGRVIASIVAGIVVTALGVNIAREILSHHFFVVGNDFHSKGFTAFSQKQNSQAESFLSDSVKAYTQALALAPHNSTALNNRAASLTLLKRFDEAVADYDQMIAQTSFPKAGLYANRSIAKQSWAATLSDSAAVKNKELDSVKDLDRAIELSTIDNKEKSQFYLWRGVLYHALGEYDTALSDYNWVLQRNPNDPGALAGKGWAYFIKSDLLSRKALVATKSDEKGDLLAQATINFQIALTNFQSAVLYTPANNTKQVTDNYIAVGYAYFRLEDYQKTLEAWQKAVEVTPDDPTALVSRATAYYKLATSQGNGCGGTRTVEVQSNSAKLLELSIADLNAALKIAPSDHFTYRTRGQLEFILSNCSGYDAKVQVTKALASYDEALKIDPGNDFYLQYRARLTYTLANNIFVNEPTNAAEARKLLDKAIADINRAYEIAPSGPILQSEQRTKVWKDFLEKDAWTNFYSNRAKNYYENKKQPDMARLDYEEVAKLLPADPTPAFRAGLMSLLLGDTNRTGTWYKEGLTRTKVMKPEDSAKAIKVAIDDITKVITDRSDLRTAGNLLIEDLNKK